MPNERLAYLLIIIQVVLTENMADSQNNSFLSKIVNQNGRTRDEETFKKLSEQIVPEQSEIEKCKHRCSPSSSSSSSSSRFVRPGNQGTNSSDKSKQMEAPSSKHSFFNVLTGDEDQSDDDDDDDDGDPDIDKDDYGNHEKIKEKEEDEEEEEEEDEEEDVGMSLFDDEEDEINPNKLKDENEESFLKQYHRHRMRLHNMVFPLLLAYKLKFFTVIPLLLGSLVLLVGTTGVAGFFFALFAAALGLHVKSSHHHHHHS